MRRAASIDDRIFAEQVEACDFPVSEFDHRAHLRLAYIYLVELSTKDAVSRMRDTLINLLRHAGIEPTTKYHETLTEAWIRAVDYFMSINQQSDSSHEFIEQHPEMLDSDIMLTHYSAEVLFSEEARGRFVSPNLEPIPEQSACSSTGTCETTK